MNKPKKRKEKQGRTLQDRSHRLAVEANPVRWDAPSSSLSKKDFYRLRWINCPYYKGCLDYTYSLHWEGWACCWCVHNPYGDIANETNN